MVIFSLCYYVRLMAVVLSSSSFGFDFDGLGFSIIIIIMHLSNMGMSLCWEKLPNRPNDFIFIVLSLSLDTQTRVGMTQKDFLCQCSSVLPY